MSHADKVIEAIKAMTPEERVQSLISAGIIREDGTLMPQYGGTSTSGDIPTPETDAEQRQFGIGENRMYISAGFARDLERRLAAATARAEEAEHLANSRELMSNPTPCLWNVRWDCPNNGLALEGIRTAPIDPLNADDIRVQLAKKLGYHVLYPSLPPSRDKQLMFRKDRSDWHILSLYDLVQQGEELLTEEQADKYIEQLCYEVEYEHSLSLFGRIRLSNLTERAKAMIEVLP